MSPAEIERRKADLCASYQAAVFSALVRKSKLALDRGFVDGRSPDRPPQVLGLRSQVSESTPYRSFGLSGGVANNRTLQAELEKVAQAQGVNFLRAQPKHTGDNAGMIAFAAWAEPEAGDASGFDMGIEPSWELA